jgi:hypothetical protein
MGPRRPAPASGPDRSKPAPGRLAADGRQAPARRRLGGAQPDDRTRRSPAPRRALHAAHPRGLRELSPRRDDRQLRLATGRDRHERRRSRTAVGSEDRDELAVTLQPGVSPARGKALIEGALAKRLGAGGHRPTANGEAEVSAVLGSTLSETERHHDRRADHYDRLGDRTDDRRVWQGRGRFNSLISIGMSLASSPARLLREPARCCSADA